MKTKVVLASIAACMSGCATTQGVQEESWIDSSNVTNPPEVRQQERDSQKIVNYFHKLNPPKMKVAIVIERTTIGKALSKHVPADYKAYTSPEVDPMTPIVYDSTRPWSESLGKSCAEVSVEVSVNHSKKIVQVKPLRTTIAEIIERYVPSDYHVYADPNVNLGLFIRYEKSREWFESLGQPLAEAGIEMTANVTKKVMMLRQVRKPTMPPPTTKPKAGDRAGDSPPAKVVSTNQDKSSE